MIRLARFSDINSINNIYNYEVVNGVTTFDCNKRSYIDGVRYFLNHRSSNHPLFVYEKDNRVVGYCSLSTYRSLDAFSSTVEISLYIDKEYRGQHIGSELLKYALSYAKNEGSIHNIVAVITSTNMTSISLFKKNDFKDGGTIEQCGRKFNQNLGITNLYYVL